MSTPGIFRGNDGLFSGSRLLLFVPAGIVFGIWLAVMAGIAWWGAKWANYEAGLDWGQNFVFLSLAPYVANAIAGGLARMGKGDAAATVVNVAGDEKSGGSAVAVSGGGARRKARATIPDDDDYERSPADNGEPNPYLDDESG